MLSLLWGRTAGLDQFEAERLCELLDDLSLFVDYTADWVRLHDIIGSYLRRQGADGWPLRMPPCLTLLRSGSLDHRRTLSTRDAGPGGGCLNPPTMCGGTSVGTSPALAGWTSSECWSPTYAGSRRGCATMDRRRSTRTWRSLLITSPILRWRHCGRRYARMLTCWVHSIQPRLSLTR